MKACIWEVVRGYLRKALLVFSVYFWDILPQMEENYNEIYLPKINCKVQFC